MRYQGYTKQPHDDYETRSHAPEADYHYLPPPECCSISDVDKLPLAVGPCEYSPCSKHDKWRYMCRLCKTLKTFFFFAQVTKGMTRLK